MGLFGKDAPEVDAENEGLAVPAEPEALDANFVPVSLPMSVHTAKLAVQDTDAKLAELKAELDKAADDWYATVVGSPGAESAYLELKNLAG